VDQLKAGVAADYEPMQLRVLIMQARGNLVQARNRYVSAWKQLAAAMGLPGMAPTEIAGRPDVAIPAFKFDTALARVLAGHTDVLTAQNGIRKARYNLRLAQIIPIPDVDIRMMLQRDFTGPPFELSPSLAVGVPVPVWDRNQGGIMQAQGQLVRAVEESHRVRNDLTSRLSDAFERYENNRVLLAYYRDNILPDQVRAYKGVYERHDIQPDMVGFGDVVAAQQTLASAITTYIATLGAQWTAVVDMATLIQTDDLWSPGDVAGQADCIAAVPDLAHLLELPCGHVCSPLKDPALKGGNGHWPNADPGNYKEPAPKPETLPAPKTAPMPAGKPVSMPDPEPLPRSPVGTLPMSTPTPDVGPIVIPTSAQQKEAPVLETSAPAARRTFTPAPVEDESAPPPLPKTGTSRIPALPNE
jgi:cobalt-zinc-cadmium efflux system outer membrane protein